MHHRAGGWAGAQGTTAANASDVPTWRLSGGGTSSTDTQPHPLAACQSASVPSCTLEDFISRGLGALPHALRAEGASAPPPPVTSAAVVPAGDGSDSASAGDDAGDGGSGDDADGSDDEDEENEDGSS